MSRAIVVCAIASLMIAIQANSLDLYVSPQGNDAWSGKLKEPNKKKSDGPFASITGARDAVRKKIAAGLTEDIKISIREGMYYLPQGITFGPEDSGNNKFSITYCGYPGERSIFFGATPLKKWSAYKDDIIQADIPENVTPKQVFENNIRLELARFPAQGYLRCEKPVESQLQQAFTYPEGAIPAEQWDTSGATVFIWPMHDWFSNELPILTFDAKKRQITMSGKTGYEITAGNRFFLRNVMAALDKPGESRIDLTARKVYCWPYQKESVASSLCISSADALITIQGQQPIKIVRNLHFKDLFFLIANGDIITITNAESCSFTACIIENASNNGVTIRGHAQQIRLYGNLIAFNGGNGVEFAGPPPGEPDVNNGNIVENNHIHHCGKLIGHSAGVVIAQSGKNHIAYNHIHHMPRYGISIKGVRYQVLREQLAGVTWSNHWDFLYSRDNWLAYNDIHHVNQDSQDTGAIESWGPGKGNIIDHNKIYEVGNTEMTIQSGIYLDDASDYFTVTNNCIYGVQGAGGDQCIYVKGIGNEIRNNILHVAPDNDCAIRSFFMADERCDNHQYTQNIILFEGEKGAIYGFDNWSDTRVAAADNNIFWKPAGTLAVRVESKQIPFAEWKKDHPKLEAHSITQDPLLVNAALHDYRLTPESSAHALGIIEIIIGNAGLKKDFPERFQRN